MSKNNSVVAEFISLLFESRNQAHVFHLQTSSYAAHKALNFYYDSVIPLADKYAESYQGQYGIISGFSHATKIWEGDNKIISYFLKLQKEIKSMRRSLPDDLDLENIYADVLDLINSTLYLLKELK
jgi:hypothetical protein